MDLLITAALDLAFFLLFGVSLQRWLRLRTSLAFDTMLVFAAVAVLLAIQLVRQLAFPQAALAAPVALVGMTAFLAQPLLTMRVIANFRPGMRRALWVSFGLFVVSVVLVARQTLTGASAGPATTATVVGSFVLVEFTAAYFLVQEARRRAGAARGRLYGAAAGTLLFGAAVVVAGTGSAVAGEGASVFTLAARLLALLAGVAYLTAFVPPLSLRRLWQRSVAIDFMRAIARHPDGDAVASIWGSLLEAARQVSGARGALVAVHEQGRYVTTAVGGEIPATVVGTSFDPTDIETEVRRLEHPPDDTPAPFAAIRDEAGAARVTTMRIGGEESGARAVLALFTARNPLFVEDDLAVLEALGDQAAIAVEREQAMAERAALIEQLRRINAELAHASAAKTEFLAGMSHELRTPLHAVIGFSELLMTPDGAGGAPGPTVSEYAAHIHGAGLHLLDLINDVLDLARVEAGRLDLQYARFDLTALAQRTANTMRPLAARKGIDLVVHDAPPIQVEADAARLRQVLFNLLSNALKFTPTGGRAEVSVDATADEARIVVTDDGAGIPIADQARVFEPFAQANGTADRREGTGLGLAVTRQLVEGHRGRVTLESAPGEGSRFTVAIPLRNPADPGGPASPAEATDTPVAEPDEPGRSVILVVEDDARAAGLVSIHLRGAGYRVAVARDGRAALAEAERLRPAAIVLDVLLPGLDGWGVLRRLKEQESTREIPVVILSVLEESDIGFALGAADYLVKPTSRDTLIATIDRHLGTTAEERRVGRRVLVIDDDPAALDLYQAELGGAGYLVARATGGEEGLRVAREQRPDAILLDLLMEDVDGFAVADRLRADDDLRDIPIVVVTSHDLDESERQRLDGNVRAVLRKGEDGRAGLLRWLRRVARPRDVGARRRGVDASPRRGGPLAER